MEANLLANMELGIHQPGISPRATSDSIQMQPMGKSDDVMYQMRGTMDSDDGLYSKDPVQVTHLPLPRPKNFYILGSISSTE